MIAIILRIKNSVKINPIASGSSQNALVGNKSAWKEFIATKIVGNRAATGTQVFLFPVNPIFCSLESQA
jgi:hypothetical protein